MISLWQKTLDWSGRVPSGQLVKVGPWRIALDRRCKRDDGGGKAKRLLLGSATRRLLRAADVQG